jgi:hypothetical protein
MAREVPCFIAVGKKNEPHTHLRQKAYLEGTAYLERTQTEWGEHGGEFSISSPEINRQRDKTGWLLFRD